MSTKLLKGSLTALSLVAVSVAGLTMSKPAEAQAFERDWMISGHVARTELDGRSVEEGSIWESLVDDSGTGMGVSLSYYLTPYVSVRGTYETVSSLTSENRCLEDTCPLIAVNETGSLRHSSVSVVPEFPLTQQIDAFLVLGMGHTSKSAGPELANYSETDFLYGAGVGYRFNRRFYVSAEYQTAGSDYSTYRLSLGVRF